MTVTMIIFQAASAAKVSGALLLAICTYESGLKNPFVPDDGGSPSHGVCQLKYDTAKLVGYTGTPNGLMDPKTNATYAAKYLRYQMDRYGDRDWHKLSAAYNAGTYNPSDIVPGCPRNLKYVKEVTKHLSKEHHYKMECGKKH